MNGRWKNRVSLIKQEQELKVTDLIDKATLQALQDQFTDKYSDYKVGNGLLDVNADPITFERGHCAYCKAVRETEEGYSQCRKSDRVLIKAIKRSRKAYWRICEGQLLDFGAPILIENRVAAFFLWGQIRCEYCKDRSNGISRVLKQLDFGKARDGHRRAVAGRLRNKYSRVKNRNETEIQEIAKGGLDFAERLSWILNKLVKWEKPREVDEFVAKMVRQHDLDSLFDLCVREIPRLLGTKDCSVFTVVRESAEVEPRLVLQKTSYKKSKHQEGRASYTRGEGLTGWVWQNRCALRLDDINDTRELGRYPGLEWSRTVDDSDHHKEWLGVPLFGHGEEVICVIRVPEKKRRGKRTGGGFDFRDEICLMMVGQSVAREIEVLRQRKRALAALKVSQECAVKLCYAEDHTAIAKTVVDACVKIFGGNGKAHFFHVLSKDNGKLRVQEVRGSLTANWMKGREIPKDSLSWRYIEANKEKIIHNIPKASSEGCYFELAKGLECAMSIPIRSGNEVFGALSVGADRQYEFTEEPDLHILMDIANITAATFARLQAQQVAQQSLLASVRGMMHCLGNRIPTLKNWLSLLQRKAGNQFAEEIDRLEEGIDFIVGAVDVATRFGKMTEPVHIQTFELRTVLRRLERLYPDRRICWKIQSRLPMLGDPRLIEQAVVELLTNALRFIPKRKGSVKVSAYRRKIEVPVGTTRNGVIIQIDDNGSGIVVDRKEDIFRPSVTTDPGFHFGFGLSFVQNVVQRYGGYIEERGKRGYGASFRMVFPQ